MELYSAWLIQHIAYPPGYGSSGSNLMLVAQSIATYALFPLLSIVAGTGIWYQAVFFCLGAIGIVWAIARMLLTQPASVAAALRPAISHFTDTECVHRSRMRPRRAAGAGGFCCLSRVRVEAGPAGHSYQGRITSAALESHESSVYPPIHADLTSRTKESSDQAWERGQVAVVVYAAYLCVRTLLYIVPRAMGLSESEEERLNIIMDVLSAMLYFWMVVLVLLSVQTELAWEMHSWRAKAARSQIEHVQQFLRYVFHEARVPLQAVHLGSQEIKISLHDAIEIVDAAAPARVHDNRPAGRPGFGPASAQRLARGQGTPSPGSSNGILARARQRQGVAIPAVHRSISTPVAAQRGQVDSTVDTDTTVVSMAKSGGGLGDRSRDSVSMLRCTGIERVLDSRSFPVRRSHASEIQLSDDSSQPGGPGILIPGSYQPQQAIEDQLGVVSQCNMPEVRARLMDMQGVAYQLVQGCASMRRIFNDVLDAERLQRGRLRLVQAAFDPRRQLGRWALKVHARHAHLAGITLEVHDEDIMHAKLVGDAQRLQQIVTNLVSNAIRYSARGSRVIVGIRELQHDACWGPFGAIRASHAGTNTQPGTSSPDGSYLLPSPSSSATLSITVSDKGPGIRDSALETLFDPFAEGVLGMQPGRESTGMGLFISRGIARYHGGDLRVVSTRSTGSLFEARVRCGLVLYGPYDSSELPTAGESRHVIQANGGLGQLIAAPCEYRSWDSQSDFSAAILQRDHGSSSSGDHPGSLVMPSVPVSDAGAASKASTGSATESKSSYRGDTPWNGAMAPREGDETRGEVEFHGGVVVAGPAASPLRGHSAGSRSLGSLQGVHRLEANNSKLPSMNVPGNHATKRRRVKKRATRGPSDSEQRAVRDYPIEASVSRHVLVVDDERIGRSLMCKGLTREGFVVHEAENGSDAIKVAYEVMVALQHGASQHGTGRSRPETQLGQPTLEATEATSYPTAHSNGSYRAKTAGGKHATNTSTRERQQSSMRRGGAIGSSEPGSITCSDYQTYHLKSTGIAGAITVASSGQMEGCSGGSTGGLGSSETMPAGASSAGASEGILGTGQGRSLRTTPSLDRSSEVMALARGHPLRPEGCSGHNATSIDSAIVEGGVLSAQYNRHEERDASLDANPVERGQSGRRHRDKSGGFRRGYEESRPGQYGAATSAPGVSGLEPSRSVSDQSEAVRGFGAVSWSERGTGSRYSTSTAARGGADAGATHSSDNGEQVAFAVLMDRSMPVMGGIECTRELRRRFGDSLLIIGLTGDALPEDLAEFRAAGLDNVFSKPMGARDVAAAIVSSALKRAGDEAASGRCKPSYSGKELLLSGKAKPRRVQLRQGSSS